MTPQALTEYRERTARNERSSTNQVNWNYNFKCPVCHDIKPTAGRVSRGWQKGFRCADCEVLRLERKAAKHHAKEQQRLHSTDQKNAPLE